jgi:hypothetical protein
VTRGKLEKELEATYRRLRECEARLPHSAPPSPEATAASGPGEAATAIQPAVADAATSIQPAVADADTAIQLAAADAVTAERPAVEPPETPAAQ